MTPALRAYNAAYLRNIADLLEANDYELEAVGGAYLEPGDVIRVKLDMVATPLHPDDTKYEVRFSEALQEHVDTLLRTLNNYCINVDSDAYGMPLHGNHLKQLRNITLLGLPSILAAYQPKIGTHSMPSAVEVG